MIRTKGMALPSWLLVEDFLKFLVIYIFFKGPYTVNIHAGLACEKVGKASHKAIHHQYWNPVKV